MIDLKVQCRESPEIQVCHPVAGEPIAISATSGLNSDGSVGHVGCWQVRASMGSLSREHSKGKKSRTPSVEARIVGTKQQFRKSKERFFFYSTYISFTRFPFFFFFSPSLLVLLFSSLFYTNLFSFGIRLFLARGWGALAPTCPYMYMYPTL